MKDGYASIALNGDIIAQIRSILSCNSGKKGMNYYKLCDEIEQIFGVEHRKKVPSKDVLVNGYCHKFDIKMDNIITFSSPRNFTATELQQLMDAYPDLNPCRKYVNYYHLDKFWPNHQHKSTSQEKQSKFMELMNKNKCWSEMAPAEEKEEKPSKFKKWVNRIKDRSETASIEEKPVNSRR